MLRCNVCAFAPLTLGALLALQGLFKLAAKTYKSRSRLGSLQGSIDGDDFLLADVLAADGVALVGRGSISNGNSRSASSNAGSSSGTSGSKAKSRPAAAKSPSRLDRLPTLRDEIDSW